MRSYVGAKLHGLRVTDKSVLYTGSVSIDKTFLDLVGIDPYEQVTVVDLNNGNRWITYALPSDVPGAFTLNGGGARLGEIGDVCVLMTYRLEERFSGARVLFFEEIEGHVNQIAGNRYYPSDADLGIARAELGDPDLSGGVGTPR